mgnify:CR=1 FL=1
MSCYTTECASFLGGKEDEMLVLLQFKWIKESGSVCGRLVIGVRLQLRLVSELGSDCGSVWIEVLLTSRNTRVEGSS